MPSMTFCNFEENLYTKLGNSALQYWLLISYNKQIKYKSFELESQNRDQEVRIYLLLKHKQIHL